ncbi:hypothetical protein [Hymenobacter sp. YC55]|uniref:hypothetical protein n=1 Tax=Hymenobacter sp. YC55 TaxID=3034019 RepID=UPI0023F61969|nr:hypothetical protein [Hymenobacter sp. YC55]MDF7809915.1 hypothetical protein [Hymenobacter sp. YC55]
MRNLIFGLMAMLLLLSCSPLRELRKTPAEKVAGFIADHPELVRPETVQVKVPFVVPQVRFERSFPVIVHDTIWRQKEASQLDSLINHLSISLDTAQRTATKAKLHQLLDNRPVLRDTLCFDTLGVQGRLWLKDRVYKLEIIRAAIQDTAKGAAVLGKLAPCPPPTAPGPLAFEWLQPATWAVPWWVWLLLGICLGVCLLQGAVMLAYRFLTRQP